MRGHHLFKGGFAIPDFSRRGFDDRTNSAGTFTFSSLEDYANGRPLSFVQQRGDGHLVFLQKVFGAFLQDQISVGSRFSVTPGVRYDWQNVFVDNNNIAPRISATFMIDPKTAIRGGAGIFYDRAGDGAIHGTSVAGERARASHRPGSLVSGSLRRRQCRRDAAQRRRARARPAHALYGAVRSGPGAADSQGHDDLGQLPRDARGRALPVPGHQCTTATRVSHPSRISPWARSVRLNRPAGRRRTRCRCWPAAS